MKTRSQTPTFHSDLRMNAPPIYAQEGRPSCGASAACFAYRLQRPYADPPSRLYLWRCALNGRAGCTSSDIRRALATQGLASEREYPYVNSLLTEPSPRAHREARRVRIRTYTISGTRSSILACLRRGVPVIFGLAIDDHFQSEGVASSGVYDRRGGRVIEQHAMVCVGYCPSRDMFLIANSYGTSFGMEGYCLISRNIMDAHARDFYTMFTAAGV